MADRIKNRIRNNEPGLSGKTDREVYSMEQLLEIRVICEEPIRVKGGSAEKVMIPFGGTAEGRLFSGKIIGPGVDTQTIRDGVCILSARYMLEGRDADGNRCRIFIENRGNWEEGFHPEIVTDSALLKDWENADLSAFVEPAPGGVTVKIFSAAAKR